MLGTYRAVLPPRAQIEFDPDAPMAFAVLLDDDIIGAGDSIREAVTEARQQLRTWRWRALDVAHSRAWRVADKAPPPYGERRHGAALSQVARCCSAMIRMNRVAFGRPR